MTQPKIKGGIPPIEIYTIVKPSDPTKEQDDKNEDDEFKRIENELRLKGIQSQDNPLPK